MKILGIQKDHNASACLFNNDTMIYFNQEERLSRIKHDSGLPIRTLEEICNISPEIDVLLITGYDSFFTENLSIISILKKLGFKLSKQFEFVPYYKSHHLMHASNAFFNSEFKEALILVCDGKGSFYNLSNGKLAHETTSVFSASYPNKFELVYRRFFSTSPITDDLSIVWDNNFTLTKTPNPRYVNKKTIVEVRNDLDLGHMYEGTSRAIGFDDEGGKMMSLQSYGQSDDTVPNAINDQLQCNMGVFRYDHQEKNRGFDTLIYPELSTSDGMVNFAHKVQKAFETVGLKLIKDMLEVTGHTNLILTGGTALNVVANNFYRKNLPDHINMYIEPVCGDEGNCIGICQYFYNERYKSKEIKLPTSIYICGVEPSYEYVLAENEIEISNATDKAVASLIRAGHVVALFQGKGEAGPRALGNRSLLFDPRIKNGKEIVNKIKGRELFRPFAASVMLEHANDWFDLGKIKESPYMMYAVDVKADKLDTIPAVLHVDNTCRIQTVTECQNKTLYNILKEFNDRTGIPLVLNTSFNLAGDPIVETVNDAILSLRKSNIDYLYLPEIRKLIYIKV